MKNTFLILINLLYLVCHISNTVNAVTLDAEFLANLGYNTDDVNIDLRRRDIDSVDQNAFDGYNQLSFLSLAINPLKNIDLIVFTGAPNLKALILVQTLLTQITNVNNVTLSSLEFLDLTYTSISILYTNVIAGLPNLANYGSQFSRNLSPLKANQLLPWTKLINLHITTVNQKVLNPQIFNGLSSIKTISFISSNIESIEPNTFAGLLNLNALDLTNNSLTSLNDLIIPKTLGLLKCLHNRLTSLELCETNGYLSIEQLDLSGNLFTTLESIDFYCMPNLTIFHFVDNPITDPNYIYLEIQGADKLIYLTFRLLGISTINVNFFQGLTKLEYVDLAFNQISIIDSYAFFALPNVKSVAIFNNNLTQLDNTIFSGISSLVSINIANNQITSLGPGTFANIENLKSLFLDHNQLTTLDRTIFMESSNIEVIYLSYNQLSYIEPGTFNNMLSLQEIFLEYNQLREIDTNMFNGCMKLKKINVQGNPGLTINNIRNLCPTQECQVYYNI